MTDTALTWTAVIYFGMAAVILCALLFSLVQIFRGPSPAERVLAAQLMGTAGVSVLLLMDMGLKRAGMPIEGLINVALVFAVLAGVAGIAFVYRGWEWRPGVDEPGEESHDADA